MYLTLCQLMFILITQKKNPSKDTQNDGQTCDLQQLILFLVSLNQYLLLLFFLVLLF